jgi:hypothetical protein
MIADRDRVRALVREELERRLSPEHPALLVIVSGTDDAPTPSECLDATDLPQQPCVIEPDRPCYNSGYCKRLGY